MSDFKKIWKGLLVCLVIASAAWFLGQALPLVGGPVFAILLGIIISFFWQDKTAVAPGLAFASKKILQAAVVFLGFGMNLSDILAQGRKSLPIILVTIILALTAAFLLQRFLKIPTKIATLIGVGSAICGGSAIAATAPVIDADNDEITQAISVIFLFNILAALLFPTLGGWLGLSNDGFGLFAGTAINDTSSVTAAASAWDDIHNSNSLDIATIVKLTRTLAIIPIVLGLTFYKAKKSGGTSLANVKKAFPFFVLLFLLASVVTTVFALPAGITAPLKKLSKFLIITAMAAIGMNTNIVKLIRTGARSILMGLCCWVTITAVSLIMQISLGIL